MKNLSTVPGALAAVVQLATLAGLAYVWHRQRHDVREVKAAHIRLDVLRTDIDSRLATQAWRQAFDLVSERSAGRATRRHLASVTALPCPKGVRAVDTPGGAE